MLFPYFSFGISSALRVSILNLSFLLEVTAGPRDHLSEVGTKHILSNLKKTVGKKIPDSGTGVRGRSVGRV